MKTVRTLSIPGDVSYSSNSTTAMEIISVRLIHVDNFVESPLGVVILENYVWHGLYLPSLRDTIRQQLSHVLPPRFEFCTPARYL